MEGGLGKCNALAFHEVMNASKGHTCGLVEEVANTEGIYTVAEAKFDNIVVTVAKEVKAFVRLKGEEQRKEYNKKSRGLYAELCMFNLFKAHFFW